MNKLATRTLTAAGIIVFVLGGFWLHPLSFFLTGLIVASGCQLEYYRMIKRGGLRPQVLPGMISGIAVYISSSLVAARLAGPELFLILLPALGLIMIGELYRKNERPFDSLAHTFFSIIYTVLPFSLFPFSAFYREGIPSLLSHSLLPFSPAMVVGFFMLQWTNDTVAYMVGVSMGRHRLFERISPAKSWEGFLAGAIISLAVAFLLGSSLGITGRWGWMVAAVIVSVTGTYGDLVESMLKRSAGVKDSGTVMPGHGGFLDRFDSLLISFPLYYLFMVFLA